MKKLFLFLFFCLGTLRAVSPGALTQFMPQNHISVSLLPSVGSSLIKAGPFVMYFRCTNHTAAPLPLEIVVSNQSHQKVWFRISRHLQLPGLSTSEVAIAVPFSQNAWSVPKFEAFSDAGVRVKHNHTKLSYNHFTRITSPAFGPDLFEYLLDHNTRPPIPVREWPADHRAYAGRDLVVLDATDQLSPAVRKALTLAAAQGTHILTLVRGKALWPAEAGQEPASGRVLQKIGFGSWTFLRTQAVSSNPRWKTFAQKKQAILKKHGSWHHTYKRLKWEEAPFNICLSARNETRSLHASLSLPEPPIPLKTLCTIMICFVIIIGPVNILVLKHYRKELLCLVTIPVLSLLFTGTVILSIFLSEGFASRGKGKVETFLDQRTGLAASRGSFAVYSPIASRPFRFASGDLLYFHNPGSIRGEAGDTQTFTSALARSRMSFSYAVSRAGFISEKIAVSEKESSIEIVNGLGVPLTGCLLANSHGKLFRLGNTLEPGARASLKPAKITGKEKIPKKNCYTARVSKPFFISNGMTPDHYEYEQTVNGIWR